MGHTAIHIEASGLHDNGREDDIDAMVKRFANELALAGHQVHAVSVTSGVTKELLNADQSTPLHPDTATAGAAHAYRHRPH